MTHQKLAYLLYKHNIPESVTLKSDSGWECGPTEMDGVYYNSTKNIIVFTQELSNHDCYYSLNNGWIPLR